MVIGDLAVTTRLDLVNLDLAATTTAATDVYIDDGYYEIDTLSVGNYLEVLNSTDLITDVTTADHALFSGDLGDFCFRLLDIVNDVTFSSGQRFEATGGPAPDGLYAGGTVLLTGADDPTGGTHSPYDAAWETLDADPSAATSVGKSWLPFYELDGLVVRRGAKVYVEAQVLVDDLHVDGDSELDVPAPSTLQEH